MGRVINLILPIAVGYLQGCSNVRMLIHTARSDFMIGSHQNFFSVVRCRKCAAGWINKTLLRSRLCLGSGGARNVCRSIPEPSSPPSCGSVGPHSSLYVCFALGT